MPETNRHPSVLTSTPCSPALLACLLLLACRCRKRSFYDAEVRSLRKQLRDTYESLLFLDAAFAAANDVEGQMWRTVFYLPIEEFRSRIRKAEKEAEQQQKAGTGPAAAVVSGTERRVCWGLWCDGSMRMHVAAAGVEPAGTKGRHRVWLCFVLSCRAGLALPPSWPRQQRRF